MKAVRYDTRERSQKLEAMQPQARERLDKRGVSSLSDRELLMVLLGTGSKGKPVGILAEEVLTLMDRDRTGLSVSDLTLLQGMGSAKAATVLASLELGKRLYGFRSRKVGSPGDLYPLVQHWADRKQEHFMCATLNGAHDLIDVRVISRGLINRAIVHPREVFADAVSDRACAVLVAHNHPSGHLEPSREDIDVTRKLKEAGRILGIPLLDHLIFSETGYYSFVEHGIIAPDRDE